MSNYIEFTEENKILWKDYIFRLLKILYDTKSLLIIWIVVQQIYEFSVYCAPRTNKKPFNVKDIKRIKPEDADWDMMCVKLMDCRHLITHSPFNYKNTDVLLRLFSMYNSQFRELISITFEKEAKYFDNL